MSTFSLYFNLGWHHITDLGGIDHILFIASLCLRYLPSDWKKILVLVTAFTIGHSITLALSVLNMVHFSTKLIELLIPITIVITTASNLFVKKFVFKSKFPAIYFFTLFFGLIHGLGFSNYLKSLLGKSSTIFIPLFSFNIGLEVGQLIIVVILLFISFILIRLFKANRREYILLCSGAILSLAIKMVVERWYW